MICNVSYWKNASGKNLGCFVLAVRAKASLKRRVRAKAAEWVWNGLERGGINVAGKWLEPAGIFLTIRLFSQAALGR